MKHILFQVLTGFTLNEIVATTFGDKKLFKIVGYYTSWKNPFNWTVTLINEYGFLEVCGSKALKDKFEAKLPYTDLEEYYRLFSLNKK